MTRSPMLAVLAACTVVSTLAAGPRAGQSRPAPTMSAADVLAKAIEAMGGEARLTSLKSLTLDSIGHGWALEQSERPEGPWLSTYSQALEVRDYEHDRRWVQAQRRNWVSPSWSTAAIQVVVDGRAFQTGTVQGAVRWAPGSPAAVTAKEEQFALSPERILLTAKAAKDLRALPDEEQQHVAQNVLGFSWQDARVRLLLNRWTHLPTMLEIVRRDPTWGTIWGDVTTRQWFSFWTLEKGGLMYPRQTSEELNGQPYRDTTVQGLTVDGALDDTKFGVPDEVRNAPRPTAAPFVLHIDESKATDVTDWIVQVPGGFNVEFVKQPDGLVVLEPTTNSAYSVEILAFAAKRYPGVPIKAVVTTSDAWPHIGGVREYVARGMPIYALDLNVPILTRMIQAPHTIDPDALAKQPKAPTIRPVSGKTVIGAGDTRMELLPVRGETGERMMLAWFPGPKLLYSSDLIQRGRQPGTFFMPEMLMEVQAAAAREGVTGIERVFGMHLAPTPWTDVLAAIDAAKR